MNNAETLTLYETLYFYELERKDKITNRIQLNFALVVINYTAFSYMLRTLDYESRPQELALFLIFFTLSIFASSAAIYLLIKAYWHNPVHHIASANDIGAHIQNLKDYYKKSTLPDSSINLNNDIEEYIANSYKEAATKNTLTNEKRNKDLYTSFKWLLIGALPLAIASLLFLVLDLDASSPRKNMLIEDKRLALELKSLTHLQCNPANAKPTTEPSPVTSQNDQQPAPAPSAPAEAAEKPKGPPLRMSMEDFKDKVPAGSQLLNENNPK